MSRFSAFTEGWSFRTNKPTFEPGTEITAFVTGRSGDEYVARIGDTILSLDSGDSDRDGGDGAGDRSADGGGADPNLLDTRVRLRVEEFNESDHTGRATVLERIGEGSF